MHILLFLLYGLLCGYGIMKMPFFRKSGIRPVFLAGFFGAHVLAGCLHNLIAWRYFPGHGDIWDFYRWSFLMRHRLGSQFDLFLSDNASWSAISHNGVIFIQVILDLFSFDNMYVNTLLFAFPVFAGSIALVRVVRNRFPGDPLTACSLILLPSTLFWTSCIHREGLLYMLLGCFFYNLDKWFSNGRPGLNGRTQADRIHMPVNPGPAPSRRSQRSLLFLCLGLFLAIAYFRSAVAMILVPAIFVWWMGERRPPRRWLLAVGGALFGGVTVRILMTPGMFHSLIGAISAHQQEFMALEGHSRLYLPALDGTWGSLWRALPAAGFNGFFEPLPGAGGQSIYLVFSAELILVWMIVFYALFKRIARSRAPALPISAAFLVFAILGMLSIGIMIPFAGAIVRYRSICLPFLLVPGLHTLRGHRPFASLNAWLTRTIMI